MNSLIIYGTLKKPEDDPTKDYALHYSLLLPAPPQKQIPIWVRGEIFNGDALSALDAASPRKDEIFLNTIELP